MLDRFVLKSKLLPHSELLTAKVQAPSTSEIATSIERLREFAAECNKDSNRPDALKRP
jgi:hypothetical protein